MNTSQRDNRDDGTLKLQHNQPMIFGEHNEKSLVMNKGVLEIKQETQNTFIHDEQNINIAFMLSQVEEIMPIGVFHCTDRPDYPQMVTDQIAEAKKNNNSANMQALLMSGETWEV